MGVIVDDTIHFVAKYKRLRATGLAHEEAIEGTLQEAGRAMIYTTIILVTGFSLFLLTDYQINANFGATVAIMLSIGMLFDLTVLPAGIKLMIGITGQDKLSVKA